MGCFEDHHRTIINDTTSPRTLALIELELLMFDHVLKGDPDRKPFSGADAAKIATINSARSLGLEAEFGSIETGKTADNALLSLRGRKTRAHSPSTTVVRAVGY